MSAAGTNYGGGLTNVDPATGIRFGLISVHSLGEWTVGAAEPIYPDEVEIGCPYCAHEFATRAVCGSDTQTCPKCAHEFEAFALDELEPIDWNYAPGDTRYETQYSESLHCVFVTKSPYYTYGRFCSPCAPGAVDLDGPLSAGEGVRGYCLGHEMFDGMAPYQVFTVRQSHHRDRE